MLRSHAGRRRDGRGGPHRRHRGHARRAARRRAMAFTRRQDRRAHAVLVRPQARVRRQPRARTPAAWACTVPPSWLDASTAAAIRRDVTEAAVRAMAAEGAPFKGVLYPGLFVTADGPRVIEFNARFGDPEAEALLPRLESDLLEIMLAVRERHARPGRRALERRRVRDGDAGVRRLSRPVRDGQADQRPRRRRQRRRRLPRRHEARRRAAASSRTAAACSA